MKINRVNLGELVLQKVESSGMSKAEFAKRIGLARQNVEKTVFAKHSLDTDLLCRISEVLECNFFNYMYDVENDGTSGPRKKERVEAKLTIKMYAEEKTKIMNFEFGNNNIDIIEK